MDPKDRRVKIHPEEMESLLNLKFKLDYQETVSSYADQYQQLGWILQAVDPQDGTDLEMDSGIIRAPGTTGGGNRVCPGPKINLEVHTGKQSRSTVLEVAKGAGELILDQYGQWRAECIAVLGSRPGTPYFMLGTRQAPLTRPPSGRPLKSGGSGKVRWCWRRLPLILKWGKPGSGCPLPGRNRPNTPAGPCQNFCSTTSPGRSSLARGKLILAEGLTVWCRLSSRCSRP